MILKFNPVNIPWICGGDFNEFLWDHEKSGGVEVRYNRLRYLEDFMGSLEIMDLGFIGPKFTWRGNRNGHLVEARLDRGLANEGWQSMWPNSSVIIGTCLGSDHCPVIVRSEPKKEKWRKLFRFEASWTKEEKCREIVKEAWSAARPESSVQQWNWKLNDCRAKLIRWSTEKFRKRGRQLKDMTKHLGNLQCNWKDNEEEIKALSKDVDLLGRQEEAYWLQRSRVQWLNEGDANTRFFHQSTLQRRRRNKVIALKNDDGQWVDNPLQVKRMVDGHFMEMFKSSGPRDWEEVLACVIRKVSPEMNASLSALASVEEVRDAALHMGGLKAPGPDSFSGIFYQKNWDILAEDVNVLLKGMLLGSEHPGQLNSTHLVLIPKVQNPEKVSQFRPISLCNYSYKILSKVLANRLKPLL